MRHPNPQRQSDRRAEILDAAERCFARSGFHRASMQDICAEAEMSPGNLYRYFPSKEALIAGICERNRADAVDSFNQVNDAPDFFEALAGLAQYHLVDRTDDEVSICAEIMAESRRHPEISKLYQTIENEVRERMAAMLARAAERGEIRSDLDVDSIASLLLAIGDGMSWRRSVDPKFSAENSLPLVLRMVHGLLAPTNAAGGNEARNGIKS
ncbi:TetR/AcrR family transcriptional regulator [Undibacter mobilis]|uniref:TetR/AcrR family transcriptional regulator n=1 Tax=Undibacter mobilis TaxID=2292256 RepID=A0A371B7K4_9BRAD|nr:TetR/AcrR family transcriptional regulator [Undibacter mobilis]RDV03477.1 TetR/AcrR family transcriptional regulator [Undibacter mobilis]